MAASFDSPTTFGTVTSPRPFETTTVTRAALPHAAPAARALVDDLALRLVRLLLLEVRPQAGVADLGVRGVLVETDDRREPGRGSAPVETRIVTVFSRSSFVPAGGSVPITLPFLTLFECSFLIVVWNPRCLSCFSASALLVPFTSGMNAVPSPIE